MTKNEYFQVFYPGYSENTLSHYSPVLSPFTDHYSLINKYSRGIAGIFVYYIGWGVEEV